MKDIKNNTSLSLEFAQYEALIQCAKILSKAFKKRIHAAYINPEKEGAPDIIHNVSFTLDKFSIEEYEDDEVEKATDGKS